MRDIWGLPVFWLLKKTTIYEKCRPKTSGKPLKNLWRPRTFQEPLGGFPQVFKCCPFQKDNIRKPKTSQKPFLKPPSHFWISRYDCSIASKITIYQTIYDWGILKFSLWSKYFVNVRTPKTRGFPSGFSEVFDFRFLVDIFRRFSM